MGVDDLAPDAFFVVGLLGGRRRSVVERGLEDLDAFLEEGGGAGSAFEDLRAEFVRNGQAWKEEEDEPRCASGVRRRAAS